MGDGMVGTARYAVGYGRDGALRRPGVESCKPVATPPQSCKMRLKQPLAASALDELLHAKNATAQPANR
jgi:hypothetical protein